MQECRLSPAEIRVAFSYDPATGKITRRTGQRADRKVGYDNGRGYLCVSLGGATMMAHRVAWCLAHGAWPVGQIDHINGIKSDNRLANLRDVSAMVNSQNQHRARRINRSAVLGVSRYPSGRYIARIFIAGKRHYLGSFATAAEAESARALVKKLPHSHPSHRERNTPVSLEAREGVEPT